MPSASNNLSPSLDDFKTSDFWFTDGSIILLVEDVAYKVHQGQLMRHSDLFRDMLSLGPQPATDVIDGCPWVQLYDDPSDMFHLLEALYDGLYFTKPIARDFCTVAAVLRMSTKYQFESLRERCLKRLETDWPTTLLGWDKRERLATYDTRYNPREAFPHPILVIQFAQEFQLEHVLPAALYDLSRYGPRKIAAGASVTPALLPSRYRTHSRDKFDPSNPDGVMLRLEDMDLLAAFRGREEGQRLIAAFINKELSGRRLSENCLNRNHGDGHHCKESFYFIMLNLLRAVSGIATGRDADPLFSLMQAVEMLSRTDFSDGTRQRGLQICVSCKEDFSLSVARAREEVWDLIPVWFGLKPAVANEVAPQVQDAA
ncbi:hypothetical protein C8Q80DRAFT_1274121 [Daedaleopsis nitida]|nr:hypothetical protein C8Q80DRAFT_1274121 [Daedaleopsis nitida]